MRMRPDLVQLRREKRSPCEDFWHTLRIGALAAVIIFVGFYLGVKP